MKRFCEKISIFLLDVDNVTEDEIDEVRFGIELILTQMILFFLLLAIGIFRNMVLETIIFIIALVGLRTFVDGYHADSFYRCMFLTTLLYLGTLYFADFENRRVKRLDKIRKKVYNNICKNLLIFRK